MYTSIIRYSLFIVGCLFISLVHATDLIAYGKECLIKEDRLNKAQNRVDELSLRSERAQRKNSQVIHYLDRYQEEKERLDLAMEECRETEPNSAYCHEVRHRFNELTYLIQQVETESLDNKYGDNNAIIDYEITKNNFNQHYDDFLALCRDSNTHYAFIQDTRAYSEVCSSPEAKKSITCSLF